MQHTIIHHGFLIYEMILSWQIHLVLLVCQGLCFSRLPWCSSKQTAGPVLLHLYESTLIHSLSCHANLDKTITAQGPITGLFLQINVCVMQLKALEKGSCIGIVVYDLSLNLDCFIYNLTFNLACLCKS